MHHYSAAYVYTAAENINALLNITKKKTKLKQKLKVSLFMRKLLLVSNLAFIIESDHRHVLSVMSADASRSVISYSDCQSKTHVSNYRFRLHSAAGVLYNC